MRDKTRHLKKRIIRAALAVLLAAVTTMTLQPGSFAAEAGGGSGPVDIQINLLNVQPQDGVLYLSGADPVMVQLLVRNADAGIGAVYYCAAADGTEYRYRAQFRTPKEAETTSSEVTSYDTAEVVPPEMWTIEEAGEDMLISIYHILTVYVSASLTIDLGFTDTKGNYYSYRQEYPVVVIPAEPAAEELPAPEEPAEPPMTEGIPESAEPAEPAESAESIELPVAEDISELTEPVEPIELPAAEDVPEPAEPVEPAEVPVAEDIPEPAEPAEPTGSPAGDEPPESPETEEVPAPEELPAEPEPEPQPEPQPQPEPEPQPQPEPEPQPQPQPEPQLQPEPEPQPQPAEYDYYDWSGASYWNPPAYTQIGSYTPPSDPYVPEEDDLISGEEPEAEETGELAEITEEEEETPEEKPENIEGSSYDLSGLAQINGRYLTQPEDLIIYEHNMDRLLEDTVRVTVSRNTEVFELEKDADYSFKLAGNAEHHKIYKYVINSDVFEEDGAYRVYLYSEDAAGNTNMNEEKAASICFSVDNTSPLVISLAPADELAGDRNRELRIRDNLCLSEVEIYAGDQKIDFESDGEVYSFKVPEEQEGAEIRVVARDEAGNVIERNIPPYVTSGAAMVREESGSAFWVILIGAAIVAGAGFLLIRRTRKERSRVHLKTGK